MLIQLSLAILTFLSFLIGQELNAVLNSTVTINNIGYSEYTNEYVGVKFLYPTFRLAPIALDEPCSDCFISVSVPGGWLAVGSHYTKDKDFNDRCECDSLTEYISWFVGLGSDSQKITLIAENDTTFGGNYSGRQYEYLDTSDLISTEDVKHFGIVTKVNDTIYQVDFGAYPKGYVEGLPVVKTIINSIEFFPIPKEKRLAFAVDKNVNDVVNLQKNEPFETLEVLSHNSFIDVLGNLHVVGEVQNNSPSSIKFVEVVGTFYDSKSQVVGTDSTYTNPSDIGPGDKAPFELLLTSASIPISDIDNYKLVPTHQ